MNLRKIGQHMLQHQDAMSIDAYMLQTREAPQWAEVVALLRRAILDLQSHPSFASIHDLVKMALDLIESPQLASALGQIVSTVRIDLDRATAAIHAQLSGDLQASDISLDSYSSGTLIAHSFILTPIKKTIEELGDLLEGINIFDLENH